MQLTARSKLAGLFVAVNVQAWAAAPTPLSSLFERADTAILGVMESAKRLPAGDPRLSLLPLGQPQSVITYACELSIRISVVIKVQDPKMAAGVTVPVVWYLPSAGCLADYDGDLTKLDHAALWLLRTENHILRTVVDSEESVWPIHELSQEVERELEAWKEPTLALTYLVLKPGALIPENRYQFSLIPAEFVSVVGLREFLTIYRSIYLASNEAQRNSISLFLSSFGYCLPSARRALKGGGEAAEVSSALTFLNPETERRTSELDLNQMARPTKGEYVALFNTPKDAMDQLLLLSCRSDARVRARSRELLAQYFGIEPSTLACVPCD